jgi:hypothetical protein
MYLVLGVLFLFLLERPDPSDKVNFLVGNYLSPVKKFVAQP